MRSPKQSPTRQTSPRSISRSRRPESPETVELRQQVADTMLSAIPSTRPTTPKRPKLSLQTALPPISFAQTKRPSLLVAADTESPTVRNTIANAFEPSSPTPSSAIRPAIDLPRPSLSIVTPSTPMGGLTSPFTREEPYKLPIGAHSILRNSPLARRHYSASSGRASKRMLFLPVKRVAFQDKPADVIPTPVFETSDDEEDNKPLTEEEREDKKAAIEAEDGHAGISGRRSKRRREWIWRPMPEDVADVDESTRNDAHETKARPRTIDS